MSFFPSSFDSKAAELTADIAFSLKLRIDKTQLVICLICHFFHMSKESITGKVLYFPYKQFSSRFGPQFFTFSIEDHVVIGLQLKEWSWTLIKFHPGSFYICGGKYASYKIKVYRGRDSWIVEKRYSEFHRLKMSLISQLDDSIKDEMPLIPPKSCFRQLSEVINYIYV